MNSEAARQKTNSAASPFIEIVHSLWFRNCGITPS